ncbi:MAG TPA: CBS domain-containing protein [Syntrophobacter fumaroxidans]|nr:CBS domain-containing protein [Syntrophobacter fumaroxidans]
MKDLKAGSVMTKPVVFARKDTTARDITVQLLNGLYSGMPITDEEDQVIGIVTELDLLEAASEGRDLGELTAEEVMTKDPFTTDIDTPISEVINLMREYNIIRLPVTEQGALVGIVSRCDILRKIIDPAQYIL